MLCVNSVIFLHSSHSLSLSLNFQDYGELSAFVKKHFEMDLEEIELSVKGWNWGTAKFKG